LLHVTILNHNDFNISYKIFAILLNYRLVATIESKLDNCQMGFRPNTSTTDNIFIVKQIYEKCCEFNIDIYNIFVDYTQAFDSVKRCQIKYCLRNYNVPSKLIRLIAATLHNTKAKVKMNGEISKEFQINCGVKQGDPLFSSQSPRRETLPLQVVYLGLE
jgi:ABC-type polysaccharide/polyol phosphate transport system ATPase subunit